MTPQTSQSGLKEIIRSTTIVGAASLVVLAIGIVRSKVFALLLGPSGIGLIGLMQSFVAAAATFGALGTGTSGVGAVARTRDGDQSVVFALRILTLILGLAVASVVALFRHQLAALVGDPALASDIGWLALAVFFSIVVIGQAAIFTGRRRYADLALLQIGGTAIGAALAIGLVIFFGRGGIVPALILIPAATFVVGLMLLSRSSAPQSPSLNSELKRHSLELLSLGIPVMVAALLSAGIQLAMRSIVLQHWGLLGVGLYQAAFALTSLNVGLVLAALGADFFPRLAAAGLSDAEISRLSNQQMRVVCLLSAPTLILLSSGAQWWLPLFYSGEFIAAEGLMRLQLVGEACRIPAWVYGFVLLARRDTKAYIVHEASNAAVLPLTILLLPQFGLDGAGIAFSLSYVCCVIVTLAIVRRRHGIRFDRDPWLIFLGLVGILVLLAVAIPLSAVASVVGCMAAFAIGIGVLSWLKSHDALPRPLQRLLSRITGGARR